MHITITDHIVTIYYEEITINNDEVTNLVGNTANTWQVDREYEEKLRNTKQGKTAELLLETYLSSPLADEQIHFKSYDEIRTDNGKKHAPFDFLMWRNNSADIPTVVASVQKDIDSTTNDAVRLSEYTREICKNNGVLIAEVKSTKINDKKKKDAKFDGDYNDSSKVSSLLKEIKKDDFLFYPSKKRTANPNYSLIDYFNYLKTIVPPLKNLSNEELRNAVIQYELENQHCDLNIRIYIDEASKYAFIIGWNKKNEILHMPLILKHMPLKDKSENAIYFTNSLENAHGIDQLWMAFGDTESVYVNNKTTTDFYHKKPTCRFLNYASGSDINIYPSETTAIASQRFIHRCRECFNEGE